MDLLDDLFALAESSATDGDLATAELLFRGLLQQQPQHDRAALRLGMLLLDRGHAAESLHLLQQAAARPSVAAYAALGKAQQQLGQADPALQSYMLATLLQSLQLNPHDAGSWFQLGLRFSAIGCEAEAGLAFRAAILVQPHFAEAYNNCAVLLSGANAIALQTRAVQIAPGRADFHTNLAHALLSSGRFAEGFREWEWRVVVPQRSFDQPRWTGQSFAGRTLLVHAEQGYGDSIQFCRYLPQVAARGGRLIVETRPAMEALLRRLPGVADCVLWGAPLPPFDLECPLPSLAALLPDEAAPTAYLQADDSKSAIWQSRLGPDRDQVTIGVIWAGNPGGDARRTVATEAIADLVNAQPDHRFFGLQRGLSAAMADRLPFTQWGGLIDDFDDLASAMTALDLVISIDTAGAHLAGALGKEVWVLLPHNADWRWWGRTADRSAWYPTARLFRQTRRGDWDDVFDRVGAALRRPA